MGTQPESKLSRQIMTAFRNRGGFCWKNHGGSTMMAGLPDIAGVYKGRFLAFETKMPGEHPTRIQQLRHAQIRAAGGVVVVVHSVAEAMAVLDRVDHGPVESITSTGISEAAHDSKFCVLCRSGEH
jgi:hypothetical protein